MKFELRIEISGVAPNVTARWGRFEATSTTPISAVGNLMAKMCRQRTTLQEVNDDLLSDEGREEKRRLDVIFDR